MASNPSIDLTPPRTPSPTKYTFPIDHDDSRELGFSTPSIAAHLDYDIAKGISDSPPKIPNESGRTDSISRNSMLSPASASFPAAGGLSPATISGMNGSGTHVYTPMTPPTLRSDDLSGTSPALTPRTLDSAAPHNPFNFTPVPYTASARSVSGSGVGEALGKRKGHKYRHSSIHASAMDSIVQAPTARTPLAVPASLPIPTRREAWRSLSARQMARLAWCLAHFGLAGYVQVSGDGSMAMTALSRLLLFDAAGATAGVAVDVMGNFDVWRRSSIKHPFGLQRADVLAGFGMSVFVAFMGLDVVSHGIEHALENVGAHEAHTAHAHGRVEAHHIFLAAVLAVLTTFISAFLLSRPTHRPQHHHHSKSIPTKSARFSSNPLSNPSHLLTLISSLLLCSLPFLPEKFYATADTAIAMFTAGLMIIYGVRLGMSVASMLLLANPRAITNLSQPYPLSTSSTPSNSPARSTTSTSTSSSTTSPPSIPRTNPTTLHALLSDFASDPAIASVDEAKFCHVHYGLSMANLRLRCRDSSAVESEMRRLRRKFAALVRLRLGVQWEVAVEIRVGEAV